MRHEIALKRRVLGISAGQSVIGLAQLGNDSLRELALRLQPNEFGDVIDTVDNPPDLAVRIEDRRIERAPIPLLKAAAFGGWPGDVVLLGRHAIGMPGGDDALERGAEIVHSGRGGVVGVVGKHLKQRAADDLVAHRHGRPAIGVVDGHDAQRRIENEVEVWSRLEQRTKVRRDTG